MKAEYDVDTNGILVELGGIATILSASDTLVLIAQLALAIDGTLIVSTNQCSINT